MTRRVLVVGAGIAGLATAAALGRHGIPSVVLERRAEALDAGLGINLPGNAVTALRALGLGDGLERLGAPLGRREYRNRRGRLLFSVDEDAFWGAEARPRCVLRGDLLSLLRTAVSEGTVRLGAEVRDVVETPDLVTVELRDGTREDGALLVGADGVRSTVRALVRFSMDELLTQVTLYWATGTINSANRSYYEHRHGQNTPPLTPGTRIEVPAGIAMFPGEADLIVPRAFAERCYRVHRWTTPPRGGHFPAHEEPNLLADDIRAFFASLPPP